MQTGHQITYKTIVKAPVKKVWAALTDPDIMRQYFFGTELETTWEIDSPLVFTGEYNGQRYRDIGVVKEFIPNQKIGYTYLSSWSNLPDEPDNYLYVTNEVAPVEGGTELTITQTNYDEEKAKHSEVTWGYMVDEMRKVIE